MRSDKAPIYILGSLGEHHSVPSCISWSQVHPSYLNVGCVVWNSETPTAAHVESRYGDSDFTGDVVSSISLSNVEKHLSLSSSGELLSLIILNQII